MKNIFIIIILLTSLNISVKSQNATFKANIISNLDFMFGNDLLIQCSRATPKNITTYFKVPQKDISSLEANFTKIHKIKDKTFGINGLSLSDLNKYAYQYIGIIIKKAKYIYINASNIEAIEWYKKHPAKIDLTKRPIVVCEGGNDYWGALYNIKTKKFSMLRFNGD